MFVYIIHNQVNGKIYVGKTVHRNLHSYLSVKRWAARSGKLTNMPIVAAMSHHGLENFSVDVLGTATSDAGLCDLERLWIIALDARNPTVGYNVCLGGSSGRLGVKTSDETKRKIGAANRGRKPKGYVRTAHHRQQLSDRMKGNTVGRKITSDLAAKWKALETPEQRDQRCAAIKAAWDRRKRASSG